METFRRQLIDYEHNRITIDREQLWQDSLVFFKGLRFNPKHALRVRFLGEPGLDAGGPSREYGSLLIKAIFSAQVKLFEGTETRKIPIYNADAVHANLFETVGKICAYLISHLDLSLPVMSPAAYAYIASGDIDEAAKLCETDDVPDYEIKMFIEGVRDKLLYLYFKLFCVFKS